MRIECRLKWKIPLSFPVMFVKARAAATEQGGWESLKQKKKREKGVIAIRKGEGTL